MFSLNNFFLLILISLISIRSFSYSVLTHEAMIDTAWEETIVPALLAKYPEGNNPEALRRAKAFAYGGSIMPDMGYYPFGKVIFTNLIHYVRGGDFVSALLNEATNMDELAFAYGALAHYTSDNYGHPIGINPSVPLMYPKMKRKFGDKVTYEQNPNAHKRAEFAFDVLQVSRGKYKTIAYHDFIGFQIAEDQLKRAFRRTYGLEIDDLFPNFRISVNTFRWTVMTVFPMITKDAWKFQSRKMKKAEKKAEKKRIVYNVLNKDQRKLWGRHYKRPGVLTKILSGIVIILPKIGPLRVVKFEAPSVEARNFFAQSFDASHLHLKRIIRSSEGLPNKDYDTGIDSHPGEYCLADGTYLDLIKKLRKKKYAGLNKELRKHILDYYSKNETSLSASVLPILEEIKDVEISK
jgi:Zinc dependent phospholipase C